MSNYIATTPQDDWNTRIFFTTPIFFWKLCELNQNPHNLCIWLLPLGLFEVITYINNPDTTTEKKKNIKREIAVIEMHLQEGILINNKYTC